MSVEDPRELAQEALEVADEELEAVKGTGYDEIPMLRTRVYKDQRRLAHALLDALEEKDQANKDFETAQEGFLELFDQKHVLVSRVKQLEAALREYANEGNWEIGYKDGVPRWTWNGEFKQGTTPAWAAISPSHTGEEEQWTTGDNSHNRR
jgi:hypothetical protein